MSFGYSVGDAVLLTQVAWKTLQNTRKACGEHNELTREVLSLHIVLQRLEQEYSKAESPLNRSSDTYKEELQVIGRGCERVLGVLNTILKKYNRLSEEERSWRKLWQKITFGNGQVADLQDLRSKIVTHTSAMSLFLNMVSLGSVGRIEQQMTDAGGDLQEIKLAIHGIAAHLISKGNNEGSALTSYTNDDKSVWKEFRRELRREGFASASLKRNKTLIVAYIRELGDRGLFDDNDSGDLQSVEELEASSAYPTTEDLRCENRSMSSSSDQPLLTAESSTSAILHKEDFGTGSGRRLFLSSYEVSNTDSVSSNVPDFRLTMKSSKDDISEQCRAGTSGLTLVSEAPTLDAKGLESTGIPIERKPLQPYAKSVADESTEEFDETEPSPISKVTPIDIPCTITTPSSHGKLSRDSREFGSTISTFYTAANGFCLAWDDLDASSLLDQFEDRVNIIIDCQQIAWRFSEKLLGRLNQFDMTANAIISNINAFLAPLGLDHGFCKRRLWLADFTSQPFKVGILSLSEDGSGDFEDLRNILININLWIWQFDDNCNGIVLYLAEENRLQSSVPSESRERGGIYERPPQLSDSEGTEVSSGYSDRDIALGSIAKGDFMRRWLQSSVQGPENSLYYGGWCRDADLNLQPWIDIWCAGSSWMAGLAVDAIWHNYHEKIAPACISWIKVSGSSAELENFQESIGRSLRLLSIAPNPGDEQLRKDMYLMSQILEDLSEDRRVKVRDMRSRKKQGKRVWLSKEHENSSTVPIVVFHTGKGCAACNAPRRTASNRATASGNYNARVVKQYRGGDENALG